MMERENCRYHDYVNIVMTRLVRPKRRYVLLSLDTQMCGVVTDN
jgi:hypothetical protein